MGHREFTRADALLVIVRARLKSNWAEGESPTADAAYCDELARAINDRLAEKFNERLAENVPVYPLEMEDV